MRTNAEVAFGVPAVEKSLYDFIGASPKDSKDSYKSGGSIDKPLPGGRKMI